jgi:hypothetical protein
MAACLVTCTHTVEEERIDVVVEGFVVKEEFTQETEIAAPGSLTTAIDLEEGDVVIAVDLVSGWVDQGALGTVSLKGTFVVEVAKTELVDVD